ncbi:GD16935 [Drosophila simulans]|uniref:GD16935 n=1 Tax=Drosophila simulans TaxID=7240 RepID=B4R6V0_DROSI|nr:GD16935 [Drosophila simulans]
MKQYAVAIILTLFVASGWTQPLDMPSQLDAEVRSVVDEMASIGKSTGEALVQQYDEIVLEPQHELEAAVEQVESRREESPECVAAEDEEITRIVNAAHEDLHACGVVAAHTSAEIASDVNAATQQLVFGATA